MKIDFTEKALKWSFKWKSKLRKTAKKAWKGPKKQNWNNTLNPKIPYKRLAPALKIHTKIISKNGYEKFGERLPFY